MGVMGGGTGEVAKQPLRVFDTMEEWWEDYNADLRRRALNRLSFEERRALGL
jgi:hypothetical protein